LIVKLGKQ